MSTHTHTHTHTHTLHTPTIHSMYMASRYVVVGVDLSFSNCLSYKQRLASQSLFVLSPLCRFQSMVPGRLVRGHHAARGIISMAGSSRRGREMLKSCSRMVRMMSDMHRN